jgi:hypothetical protein
MFHSIGMPLGLFRAMKPWKPNITTSIAPVSSGLWLVTSTSGIRYSVSVPTRAIATASCDGRRSSGYATKSRFFNHFGKKGPLFIITMMTDGKWSLTFEVAAQNQIAPQSTLHAESHSASPLATVRQTSAT